MQVLRDQSACPRPPEGTAVTIGAYDGVHLGHRAVIDQVKRVAASAGLRTAVVTFDRHPASVVRPESAPKLLTDLDQKLELLAETGVDYVLVIQFDEVRSKEPAEEFVREVLVDCLAARAVIVGEDFHFGHRRRGNVAMLRELGGPAGFDVLGIELVGVDGGPAPDDEQVSSTRIRRALADGDLATANRLLGRPHVVRGVVVHGDDRAGRMLGFPTANLNIPDEVCLPADGIYAGYYVTPDGRTHPSAISLGRRPTFYDDQPYSLLEAHLLDGDHDLYDQVGRVQFTHHLRDEVRFESVDELIAQMADDCDQARALLA
jgi:riboflavin kinase/FMN adenylyltransferase